MKDLFLENPIMSVHNGKKGSAVEKFPPEKVIVLE
jgi:hypothetical protein